MRYNAFMDEEVKIQDNIDIREALKEFEMKSSVEQTQNVKQVSAGSEVSGMVRLAIRFSGGAIKNQRQAEYALLGLVLLMIAVSLFLLFSGGEAPEVFPEGFKNQPPFSQ